MKIYSSHFNIYLFSWHFYSLQRLIRWLNRFVRQKILVKSRWKCRLCCDLTWSIICAIKIHSRFLNIFNYWLLRMAFASICRTYLSSIYAKSCGWWRWTRGVQTWEESKLKRGRQKEEFIRQFNISWFFFIVQYIFCVELLHRALTPFFICSTTIN